MSKKERVRESLEKANVKPENQSPKPNVKPPAQSPLSATKKDFQNEKEINAKERFREANILVSDGQYEAACYLLQEAYMELEYELIRYKIQIGESGLNYAQNPI